MARRVALAGVPGTGKTTVARRLLERAACQVVHLNEFADARGLLGEEDPERGSRLVDLDALADALERAYGPAPGVVLYEGHFAHEMDVDAVALLRVDPRVLVERLRARGWPEPKVRENVEAEALDVLAQEALDAGVPAAEVDATSLSVDAAADAVWAIAEGRPEAFKRGRVGTVRWSLESLPWF